MPSIRFNHVYFGLLTLAALCAFLIPARISNSVRDNIRVIFYPVARPTHFLASWVRAHVSPEHPIDDGAPDPKVPRSDTDLLQENQELRVQVANLTGRLELFEKLSAQLATIGDIKSLCDYYRVMGAGADGASRESLHIAGGSMSGIRQHAPVLYVGVGGVGSGVAGWIEHTQVGGSTVQLITDRGFRIRAGFARFIDKPDGTPDFVMIATPQVLAEGDGQASLWIRNLTVTQSKDAGVQVGDWVVINDEDWPDILQRYRLGRVQSIEPWTKGPGFVEVKVIPPTTLLNLKGVMVMVRDK